MKLIRTKSRCGLCYGLNLLDLAFTLYALCHGAGELNPLMRCVPIMIAYKVALVGALLHWLSRREEPIARKGLTAITAVYAVLNLYHIYFIFGGAFL